MPAKVSGTSANNAALGQVQRRQAKIKKEEIEVVRGDGCLRPSREKVLAERLCGLGGERWCEG